MSPKRAKKRVAKSRRPKQASARRGTRTTAARSTHRKAAKKSARAKTAKKPAPRRAAKKRAPSPKLRVVPRRTRTRLRQVPRRVPAARATKSASPRHRPFGAALAGASAKDLALFDLVRARVEVQAAIQGMVAATAETPVGEGKWNPRQILLHLYYWDREMLPWVEPAWRHDRRPPHTKDSILSENQTSQVALTLHDWEEARRLMQHARETLLEELQSVPEEPAEMWSGEHALGWLIRILSNHDRHHAAAIKNARTGNPG